MNILGYNTTSIILSADTYFQHLLSIAGTTYLELLAFTLGLFIYALFIYKFYRSLAKRDLFTINEERYSPYARWGILETASNVLVYILKYLIIFPVYITFWFAVMSLFLFVLAEEMAITQITLISIVIISGVRMTSYYKEELASDLAKVLPFALLTILLMDPNFFSFDLFYNRLMQVPSMLSIIMDFFVFSILLEFILRVLYSIKTSIFKNGTEKKEYENSSKR